MIVFVESDIQFESVDIIWIWISGMSDEWGSIGWI